MERPEPHQRLPSFRCQAVRSNPRTSSGLADSRLTRKPYDLLAPAEDLVGGGIELHHAVAVFLVHEHVQRVRLPSARSRRCARAPGTRCSDGAATRWSRAAPSPSRRTSDDSNIRVAPFGRKRQQSRRRCRHVQESSIHDVSRAGLAAGAGVLTVKRWASRSAATRRTGSGREYDLPGGGSPCALFGTKDLKPSADGGASVALGGRRPRTSVNADPESQGRECTRPT